MEKLNAPTNGKKISLVGGKGACIYTKPNIVYMGNPKTASSSIHTLFGPYNANFEELCSYVDISTLKLISVIRNPLERFISGYLEVRYYLAHLENYEHYSFYSPILAEKNETDRLSSFISLRENNLLDQHVRTQWYYLSDVSGNLLPFYRLFLFEDIDVEFKQFSREIGHDYQLPRVNFKSSRAKKECALVLQQNPMLRERINRLLKQDWALYGQVLISKLEAGDEQLFKRLAEPTQVNWLRDFMLTQRERETPLWKLLRTVKRQVL